MITAIIPKWGRSSKYALNRLKPFSAQDLDDVIAKLMEAKEHMSCDIETTTKHLRSLFEQRYNCFSRSRDRKRDGHPYRIGLDSLDFTVDGIEIGIEGDEPQAGSVSIKLDEADIALVGLDELLIFNQSNMKEDGRYVRSFGNHNYQLVRPTDVLVAGSANLRTDEGLQDFVGMFLIGNPNRPVRNQSPDISQGTVTVYVQGRYEGIVLSRYPNAKTERVSNVEKAVKLNQGTFGFHIVQTGGTIMKYDLVVYGSPIFSETLIVVNYGNYRDPKRSDLRDFVDKLKPQGFYDEDRCNNYVDWFIVLSEKLGENWINRPKITEMFATDDDINNGVRPYSLKSNKWKASDRLPPEILAEQRQYIDSRRKMVSDKWVSHIS
ncbi:hypothetical protein CMO89_01290 [Candidatus Woesearchaeota archaeon]|nr:hypothetical protein [Candidatus Woesearchaeota archaeon]